MKELAILERKMKKLKNRGVNSIMLSYKKDTINTFVANGDLYKARKVVKEMRKELEKANVKSNFKITSEDKNRFHALLCLFTSKKNKKVAATGNPAIVYDMLSSVEKRLKKECG